MVLTIPAAAAVSARRRGNSAERERTIRYVAKPAVFALCLLPTAWVIWRLFTGGLGANPIEAAIREIGTWGLRFLLLTLAITPLRQIFHWTVLVRFRRMIGLFAFFYVSVHLLTYVGVDQFFDWRAIWADIVKRTYITLGMIAFVLLLPLAITSTKGWIRRLGGVTWTRLHMLVYPAAILAVAHYYMLVKADVREPLIYAGILAALLGWRLVRRYAGSGVSQGRLTAARTS